VKPKPRTAREIILDAYANKPDLKLATTVAEDVIGAWSESEQRYVAIASLSDGEWMDMPYEMRIDGELPVRKWTPVAK
jgi:hypothetical protein